MTKTIHLNEKYKTVVSDQDYEELCQYKWRAHATDKRLANRVYVIRRWEKNKKSYSEYMHRRIMNAPKGKDVDHLNGDPLDNRRENLRICSRSENLINSRNAQGKGASFDKRTRKWFARISHNGQRIFLGRFPSQEAAFAAVAEKRAELKGARKQAHKHLHRQRAV